MKMQQPVQIVPMAELREHGLDPRWAADHISTMICHLADRRIMKHVTTEQVSRDTGWVALSGTKSLQGYIRVKPGVTQDAAETSWQEVGSLWVPEQDRRLGAARALITAATVHLTNAGIQPYAICRTEASLNAFVNIGYQPGQAPDGRECVLRPLALLTSELTRFDLAAMSA